MRKLIFSLLATVIISATPLSRPTVPPQVRFSTINEIVELYRDGQYNVIKAKLTNEGFKITSSEPDYTLHGTTNEGTFKMEYEEDSPSAAYRNFGFKQISYWEFKTEIRDGYNVKDVDTNLYGREAKGVYESYLSVYGNSGLEKDNTGCNYGETCTRIWGDIGGAPAGYIDNVRMNIAFANYSVPESSGTKTEYSKFSGTFHFARRKAQPIAPTKSVVKKANPSIKRKR
jgi:hypothetical protein